MSAVGEESIGQDYIKTILVRKSVKEFRDLAEKLCPRHVDDHKTFLEKAEMQELEQKVQALLIDMDMDLILLLPKDNNFASRRLNGMRTFFNGAMKAQIRVCQGPPKADNPHPDDFIALRTLFMQAKIDFLFREIGENPFIAEDRVELKLIREKTDKIIEPSPRSDKIQRTPSLDAKEANIAKDEEQREQRSRKQWRRPCRMMGKS